MRKPTKARRTASGKPQSNRQGKVRNPRAKKTPASEQKKTRPGFVDRKSTSTVKTGTTQQARAPQKGNPKRTRQITGPQVTTEMRIAKAIARAGLCSRREAERWIEAGRVEVNGKKLTTPAFEVGPKDRIFVDGAALPAAEPVRLWRYHKPKGLLTTHKVGDKFTDTGERVKDDRATVFDNLPDDLPRVISVGRLDYNTEGLLLLTNDGALARHLELPSTGWLRRYRVRARGKVTQDQLDALKDGITIEGVTYGEILATLDSVQGTNCWLSVAIREGKNREVRNVMASLDLEVNRLIRISYGPFQLLDLKPGRVETVKRRVLREQLNSEVVQELGLDEDIEPLSKQRGPMRPRPANADHMSRANKKPQRGGPSGERRKPSKQPAKRTKPKTGRKR